MSKEEDKIQHSKRIHQKETYVKKQAKIAKHHGFPIKDGQEHRLAKHSATTCGNSNCAMCGNPRKFFNEPTIQEKKFMQTENWVSADPEEESESGRI
jgi:formate dehydrogenase assembly factor FdhD